MTEVNYNLPMSGWTFAGGGDTGDIQEDDTGVIQVRKHTIIRISKQLRLDAVPTTRELHQTRLSLTFRCGDAVKTENPPGLGKFICTSDQIDPFDTKSEYVKRVQVWEYYGPWEAPPDGWNV